MLVSSPGNATSVGLSAGFEADLLVDDQGLVIQYQHLFERLAPGDPDA